MRAYMAKPEVKARQRDKARSVKWSTRKQYQLNRYGFSVESFLALAEAQGNRCAICRIECPPERMRIDHDHGKFRTRGLLCNQCNCGIGFLKDNPSLLRSAATYLEMWASKEGNQVTPATIARMKRHEAWRKERRKARMATRRITYYPETASI